MGYLFLCFILLYFFLLFLFFFYHSLFQKSLFHLPVLMFSPLFIRARCGTSTHCSDSSPPATPPPPSKEKTFARTINDLLINGLLIVNSHEHLACLADDIVANVPFHKPHLRRVQPHDLITFQRPYFLSHYIRGEDSMCEFGRTQTFSP